MPPPLLVVGCPRSGTSLFAKLLVAAGLTTVADERASEKYPSGYFEHVPLLLFHKAMERFPRRSNSRADYLPTTAPFLEAEQLDRPFVRTMFDGAFAPLLQGEVDFLKYPQLALSIDFLFETLGDVRVAALWRDPIPTVQSLASKEFGRDMTPFRGLRSVLLWNTYAYHICRAKERYGDRVAVIHFDRLADGTCPVDEALAGLGYAVPSVPVETVASPGLWTARTSRRAALHVGALDRLATAAAPRLGADPELTGVAGWERQLLAATDRCVTA